LARFSAGLPGSVRWLGVRRKGGETAEITPVMRHLNKDSVANTVPNLILLWHLPRKDTQ